jgi:hypothetical protein
MNNERGGRRRRKREGKDLAGSMGCLKDAFFPSWEMDWEEDI